MAQMEFSNASIPLATVLNDINTVRFGGLDLQPSYQRGYVWNDDFKDKLIYSIVKSYPTGSISVRVLVNPNDKGAKKEVVDGQQRLTTIKDFVSGKYFIKSEWSKKIINVIKEFYESVGVKDDKVEKLVSKLSNKGNPKLKYEDLPEVIKGNITTYPIPMTYIANATDEQIREYFRFLQNQMRLLAGEIINSMPATNLETFISDIKDKNQFLDIVGFADNRAEFDKIFYSIIALYDSKLQFGSTDKAILEYSAKANTPTTGLKNTIRMVEQINGIHKNAVHNINGESKICKITEGTRKRFLKYLLLLSGLGYVDFCVDTEKKLKKLKDIDDKLSPFFSAKANAVENQFIGYKSEVIEEMRFIALLTKGGHSLSRVENRMKILAHYINTDDYNVPSGIKPIEEI